MQIIEAETRNATAVCGLGDELGTIEVGKIADVIVIGGNPLEDIECFESVLIVVHNGAVIRDERSRTG